MFDVLLLELLMSQCNHRGGSLEASCINWVCTVCFANFCLVGYEIILLLECLSEHFVEQSTIARLSFK